MVFLMCLCSLELLVLLCSPSLLLSPIPSRLALLPPSLPPLIPIRIDRQTRASPVTMELDLQHLWVYLGLLVGGGVVYVSLVLVLELSLLPS